MGVHLEDLDREEILRTRATAIEQRRLSAGTSMDVGDILDRLGLRIDGQVAQAAQMLYGTKFLPDYAQALLKLGRFRGTKITGDILDNKQEHRPKSVLSWSQVHVLEIAGVSRSLPELMAPSGVKNKTRFRDQVVAPLIEAGLLEMTIPDKPRSSKQRYRTTDAGRAAIASSRK